MFVETDFRRILKRARLNEEIAFLHRFGLGIPTLETAQKNAAKFGISAAESLIQNGLISEEDYFRCMAFELGLPFVNHSNNGSIPFFKSPAPDTLSRMARMVEQKDGSDAIHIAPDGKQLNELKKLLNGIPDLKKRLRVTTHANNKKALEQRGKPSLLQAAVNRLQFSMPQFSARQVASARQAVVITIVLQVMALFAFFSTGLLLTILHIAATLFYLGCVLLRGFATFKVDAASQTSPANANFINRRDDHLLPRYSVLVAVYNEANQMPALINALLKLDWPRERLEIKLVCEADDLETIAAAQTHLRHVKTSVIEVVEVPPSQPRTKPKALNYALPLCSGRLLVIYDAEDRPDPLQLREAYTRFHSSPKELVCLQAPLVIHNHGDSWLSRLFAIEYSTLFDGLLPMLAKAEVPVPLGGTSNHFRRTALESVGAWDPFNVTEDADLGMRFARAGYKIGTLSRPTYEEAPTTVLVWRNQRTRWFKGWFQTWLVHMRNPIAKMRELGFWGTLVFHLMITGMIVSALIHPVLLYLVYSGAMRIVSEGWTSVLSDPLFIMDVVTVFGGYLTFVALAWRTLPLRNLNSLRVALWLLPLYWLLLSVAAWRALFQLFTKPHRWEKTPHGLRQSKP